ncbi:deoxyribonuclease IV [Patescibacteria group bacterium]|nr:deoxyribonuclease IV [Patescibacteria group bacterium]
MLFIGAHVSAAGGVEYTPKRANEIGCNCLQIFSGSPRVWQKPKLESHNINKFFSEREKYGVLSVFTHAIYLVNLASDKSELVDKSVAALKYDMKFDAWLNGSGVIVHLGSHQGRGWEAVRVQLAVLIKEIIAASPQESTFLIENSAGQNGKIGSNLDEIRWLLDKVNSLQLGWCFDTCHAFATGYSLGGTLQAAESNNFHSESALRAIERLGLWSTLRCIHVNDSRDEFGSGRDRHANLGEGNIPQEELKYFLNNPQIKPLPLLLEVPGFDKKGPDAQNVRLLKQLLED